MELDDLDELGQPPARAASRVSRFAPKSSKLKPQPKPEPSGSKPEPQAPEAKLEAQNGVESRHDASGCEESVVFSAKADIGMEIDEKAEIEKTSKCEDFMDVDREEEIAQEEEEEDSVIREIDVFFTPSIDENTRLYLAQYVLRPSWRPYELDERCKEVRVKPQSAEMEIDLSVNDNVNWDSDVANKLKMTKQTLVTKWRTPDADGLVVGVLMGDKLHLNPIHSVLQLRPSLDHLNPGGLKKKNALLPVKKENSLEVKPIGSSKKQSKQEELANAQMADVESWIPLQYHGTKSDLSSRYLQKMVLKERIPIDFSMNPDDYVDYLCPGPSSDANKPKGLLRRSVLTLPLEERFKKLLLQGPPVRRFTTLKHFVGNDSIEDVLAVLQKYGHLVQGLWVPKTPLVIPILDPSDNIKAAARNFILVLFAKSVVIDFAQLAVVESIKKIKEDVKKFLHIFAEEMTSSRQWKFKEGRDELFIKEHPEIVEKQAEAWESMEARLHELFQQLGRGRTALKNTSSTAKPSMAHTAVKSLNDRSAAKVTSRALTKRTITNETREALLKALPKVFQIHKVCSFQLICQGLRDLAISQSTLPKADPRIAVAAASAADSPPEELQEVISEVATNIHGFFVLKSFPDHAEYDPLRKVVINLLLARGANAKLKKSEVTEAARLALKREIPNNEYNKVMSDICETKGSVWMLKSGDGKPS